MKPYIDYTLLKPESTLKEFSKFCEDAKNYPNIVRAVCVLPDPEIVRTCLNVLAGSNIMVCSVADFPFGRSGEKVKYEQAKIIQKAGAKEIDAVINTGALRERNYKRVLKELQAITRVFPKTAKVILETGHKWYTEYLIKKATELVAESGAFCVKTSTGFIQNIPVEEKVKHIQWMHEAVPELMKKVAGGVKNKKDVQIFLDILPSNKLIFGASEKFWLF